jgi:thiol:disulfide interchange protein
MKKIGLTLILITLAIWHSGIRTAAAQFEPIGEATEYAKWKSFSDPGSVSPGGEVLAVFDVELSGDWKMYALDETLPPRSSVLTRPFGVSFEWKDIEPGFSDTGLHYQSMPETDRDVNFDMILKFFHEKARFVSKLQVSDSTAAGTYDTSADVRFQICSDSRGICLRPTTVTIPVKITVDPSCEGVDCSASDESLATLIGPSEDSSSSEAGQGLISASTDFEASSAFGLWAFLLLAMGAGLASLLTPCVFPMIPLTVSYFSKHAEKRGQAARMASAFGGSIILTFTGIGVLAAIFIGAAGAQRIASNPWVNLFITIVLVGFALSLLGLYELRLPSSLINFFDRKGNQKTGYVGVIFMGLTLTLVSFSCTAPFVGGLLAAASGGTWLYPLAGMIVYSTTFALPFILFALFPKALNSLPTSGSWMNSLKVVLGFIELAAAIKFLSNSDLIWGWNLISRPFGIAYVLVIFLLAGFYLLGKVRLTHEIQVETVGVGRVLGATGFFVFGLYMLPGLLGAPLNKLDAYLPPRKGTDVSIMSLIQSTGAGTSVVDEEAWHVDDIEGAFLDGVAQGKPVMIDFTGYTCTNCREMEANVFPRKPVAERFNKNFVLLRLYTDGLELGDEFNRFQLRLTGTVALPTYAIVDPVDRSLLARKSGMMEVDEFAAFLDAGAAAYTRNASSSKPTDVNTKKL